MAVTLDFSVTCASCGRELDAVFDVTRNGAGLEVELCQDCTNAAAKQARQEALEEAAR
jgi:ribosome-binding protein aMBF1 (putative translation factor)